MGKTGERVEVQLLKIIAKIHAMAYGAYNLLEGKRMFCTAKIKQAKDYKATSLKSKLNKQYPANIR